MGYYRGDGGNYYRGDYYRGDPFLGGLVAGVVGGAAKRAVRWVAKKVMSPGVRRAATTVLTEAAPSAAAGAVGYTLGQRAGGMPTLSPIPQMGPMSGPIYEGPRRRKMNPLNPRALRRALRRAEGFEKFAQRTVNSLYRVIDGRKVRTFKKRKSS